MNTDELIERLSAQAAGGWTSGRPVSWSPVLFGLMVTAAVFFAAFPLAPHAYDPLQYWEHVLRWAVLLLLAVILVRQILRLSQPALSWQVRLGALLWLPAFMAVVTMARVASAHPQDRWAMFTGQSWASCSASILMLSLPLLAGCMVVARQWAVTRPALMGAVLGWFSGAVAALLYTLHCTEIEPAFVLLWYGLGVGLPGWIGVWLGRRWLKC